MAGGDIQKVRARKRGVAVELVAVAIALSACGNVGGADDEGDAACGWDAHQLEERAAGLEAEAAAVAEGYEVVSETLTSAPEISVDLEPSGTGACIADEWVWHAGPDGDEGFVSLTVWQYDSDADRREARAFHDPAGDFGASEPVALDPMTIGARDLAVTCGSGDEEECFSWFALSDVEDCGTEFLVATYGSGTPLARGAVTDVWSRVVGDAAWLVCE